MAAIGSGGGGYGTIEDDFRDKLSVQSGNNSDDLEEGEIIGGDQESSDSLKSLIHPLEHSWTFWFDHPAERQKQEQKQADWGSSIRSIYTFSTVEQFWSLYNNINPPSKLTMLADFYCFKNKIKPKWEDPIYANGGSWTINFTRGKSDTLWLHTLLAMIGEQFDHGDEICGAVVNIRKQIRISIWTKDANFVWEWQLLCDSEEEDIDHLLLKCPRASFVWEWVFNSFRCPWVKPNSIKEVLGNEVIHNGLSPKARWVANHLPKAIVWAIWNERNRRIFENKAQEWGRIVIDVQDLLYDWSRGSEVVKNIRHVDFIVHWDSIVRE